MVVALWKRPWLIRSWVRNPPGLFSSFYLLTAVSLNKTVHGKDSLEKCNFNYFPEKMDAVVDAAVSKLNLRWAQNGTKNLPLHLCRLLCWKKTRFLNNSITGLCRRFYVKKNRTASLPCDEKNLGSVELLQKSASCHLWCISIFWLTWNLLLPSLLSVRYVQKYFIVVF